MGREQIFLADISGSRPPADGRPTQTRYLPATVRAVCTKVMHTDILNEGRQWHELGKARVSVATNLFGTTPSRCRRPGGRTGEILNQNFHQGSAASDRHRQTSAAMSNISAILLVALAVAVAADAQPRPWMNKADPPAVRAQKLLSEMTLDEKIVMLHGPIDPMPCCECDEANGPLCNYTGNVYPNARLGIPQACLGRIFRRRFLSLCLLSHYSSPNSSCSVMKRFHFRF